jgi:uncharacterized ferredoxin-like protein
MISQKEFEKETIIDIAKKMAIAARTAPKSRGRDTLEIMLATKNDIELIASHMDKISEEQNISFFSRDAENIRNCEVVLFIGSSINNLELSYCGYCGLENCTNKNNYAEVPCTFNSIDLGIAIGSAVSVAADNRIDNRVLFSAGKAVQELKLMCQTTKIIYGIGLSVSSKNIFYDRK